MRSHHVRAFGLVVGLLGVLGMASIAAGEALTDQQIGRQIELRLSEDAFSNVNVSVQASVVSLSGTVPSLWAKKAAIAKARDLADVTSVASDALDIESAESDRAIVAQIANDIWRVSIPGPAAAARHGVSTAPGSQSRRGFQAALAGTAQTLGLAAGSATSITLGLRSATTTSIIAVPTQTSTDPRASTSAATSAASVRTGSPASRTSCSASLTGRSTPIAETRSTAFLTTSADGSMTAWSC